MPIYVFEFPAYELISLAKQRWIVYQVFKKGRKYYVFTTPPLTDDENIFYNTRLYST